MLVTKEPSSSPPVLLAALWWLLCTAAFASAQTVEEAEQTIRWKLDEEGRVCVSPDPLAGGETDEWRGIGDPRTGTVWANMGIAGNLAFLLCGDTDLVSICDAQRFWERLGVDEDELIRRLGEVPAADAPATERMQYVLVIRALQDLGSKPAIGWLDRLADTDGADRTIRRAAAEAAADLRGAVRSESGTAAVLPPLAGVLAECPSGSTVLVVVDQTRLPPSRPLMALARRTALAVTRKHIRMAGGSVSSSTWAGAVMLSEGLGVLPYEIARRFGNHRITRTIASLRMAAARQDPIAWVSFEGVFDVEVLRGGLAREQIAFVREGDELVIPLPQGAEVRVSPTRAILTTEGEQAAPLGAERAAELVAELGDMPCTAWFHDLPISEMGGPAIDHLLPEQVGVGVPFSREDPIEIHVRFPSGNAAGAVALQIRAVPPIVESLVDQGELSESLLDGLESLEVEREGAELRVGLTLPRLDDATIEQLVRVLGG